MKAADILTLTDKLDHAASVAPSEVNGQMHLVHRGVFEGAKLAVLLKAGSNGNIADVLETDSAELWKDARNSEERGALLTGLFLGSLIMHDVEIEV